MIPFSLKTIDHIVIRALNANKLIDFYTEVIGCKLAWDRPDLCLTHLKVGDAMIDIVSIDSPLLDRDVQQVLAANKNVDHLCLRISPFDFDALKTYFKEFGIDVEPPKMRFGAQGCGLSIYIKDPEGNGIELKGEVVNYP